MMAERGIKIDHSTLNRWVVHFAPKPENAFHKKKKRPGDRWRMDWSGIPETYLKIRGQWRYYY
jgi:putative transposase